MTKNIDGFRFSTFFQKDRGAKLKMQPIWDWNLSFGNANGKQGWMPEYWYWPQLDDSQYLWFRRLFEDPDFGQRYVDRWGELRATVFSLSNILGRIDARVAELPVSAVRRLELARALAQRPRLLFLDELLAGLRRAEIDAVLELLRSVRDDGVAIVFVEHVVRAVFAVSDRVLVLDQGRALAQGTPAEIAADERVIAAYLGRRHAERHRTGGAQ